MLGLKKSRRKNFILATYNTCELQIHCKQIDLIISNN